MIEYYFSFFLSFVCILPAVNEDNCGVVPEQKLVWKVLLRLLLFLLWPEEYDEGQGDPLQPEPGQLPVHRGLHLGTVQYSIVQYSAVQYSTVQYSTVQCSTVQYSTVQYSKV